MRVTHDGKTQLAAVYRPSDSDDRPALVVLHGGGGLPVWQLTWAASLAKQGYIVLAGCYLDAGQGLDPSSFVPCPGLPDGVKGAATAITTERESYAALIDVAAGLDGVEPGAVGVIGWSLGGGLALSIDDARVKAIVADSYDRQTPGHTRGPVLLLGFTEDQVVPHGRLVAFEQAQQASGNPIESHYYPGALHLAFNRPNTTEDATARAVAFLHRHLD